MKYSEKLKDPRWQKKRLEILERDKFTCKECGDTKTTLHVHHEAYKGNPWEADNDSLKTICEHCHGLTHFLGTLFPTHRLLKYKIDVGVIYFLSDFDDMTNIYLLTGDEYHRLISFDIDKFTKMAEYLNVNLEFDPINPSKRKLITLSEEFGNSQNNK